MPANADANPTAKDGLESKPKNGMKFDIYFGRPVRFTIDRNQVNISSNISTDSDTVHHDNSDDKIRHQKTALYAILIALVGLLIPSLYLAYPTAIVYKQPISPESIDRSYYYNLHLIKQDVSNSSNLFDLKMRLLSETFSAQVPINITELEVRQIKGDNYNGTLMVIFPRANEVINPKQNDSPGVFETVQGARIIVNPSEQGFYYGKKQSSYSIRYDIQGCYNIVVITNTTNIAERQLFQPDCTEINIAGLDVLKGLELQKQNIDIQNLIIEQNNIVIKIGLYALISALFALVVTVSVSYYLKRGL